MTHRFNLVLSLWGQRHIDLFARVVLPSLMTSGNILGFAPYEAELNIYTRQGDGEKIAAIPILPALSGFIEVRLTEVALPEEALANPAGRYAAMNAMHQLGITRAAERDATMMFLAPDAVFADGTLASARETILSGKRLVLIPTARSSTNIVDALLREFNPRGTFGMVLPPRRLVEMLLRHPYEQDRWRYWGAPRIAQSPSNVYFAVGDDGFVMRGFHHHPVAIYPQEWNAPRSASGTIDDAWLSGAVPDENLCHLTTDSDHGFAVDVATAANDSGHTSILAGDAAGYIANWAGVRTDARQRTYARKNIFVHASPLEPQWQRVAKDADAVFERVLSEIDAPKTASIA